MSKDKSRSLVRRLGFLEMGERSPLGGILTNWKGGVAADTPDLVRLERDGHVAKERIVLRGPGDSRVFGPWLTVTVLRLTRAGREFLDQNRHLIPRPPEAQAIGRAFRDGKERQWFRERAARRW